MEALNTRPKSPPRAEVRPPKPQREYITKVLIGNWVEERIECPKDLNLYHEPPDKRDFTKWVPESRQPDLRINKLNDKQGSMQLVLNHGGNCRNNFVSTTDLVYTHLPKKLCGPEYRYYRRCKHIYHPQPDLMKCVGNLTRWGLSLDKEYEWKCTDVSDHTSTCFQDTYQAHPRNAYVEHRFYRDSRFTKSFKALHSKKIDNIKNVHNITKIV